MDRKHCILLYSNYSQASIDLLTYIKGLPLDFPKITGMTMICVDHDQFRDALQKNGIEYVPTLLVEYYKGATPNQTKQKFERDYIYMWIDQVMKELHFADQKPVGQEQRGRTALPGPSDAAMTAGPIDVAPPPQDDVPPQIQKVDITSLAQQMAKERDSYISDTTPAHKKGQ